MPVKSLQAAGILVFLFNPPLPPSPFFSPFLFLGKLSRREAFIFIRAIRFYRFIRLFFVVVVATGVQLSATRKIASNISLLKKISVLLPGALGICAVPKLQQNQESDIRLLPLFFFMCLMTDIVPQGPILPLPKLCCSLEYKPGQNETLMLFQGSNTPATVSP